MLRIAVVLMELFWWLPLILDQTNSAHTEQILRVCATGCDYRTIQAAVDAAAPNDTILVSPGNYVEHLSLFDKQLQIIGEDAATTILSGGNRGRPLFLYANSTLTLTNVTVRNGYVDDNQGGGIYNDGVLTLNQSKVISNSASVSGGGIANFGTMIVNSSIISANVATMGNGGAIVNGGRLTVTTTTIMDNYAAVRGGGIYHGVGRLALINSTVAANRAKVAGGGVANFDWMKSTNSTLSANSTSGAGGGLLNGGQMEILNLTVADNHAGDGNSLYNSGTFTATNSILTDGAAGKNCTSWGIVVSLGSNLDSDAFCGFSLASDLSRTDPLLAPLADNDGSTQTHALLAGSPAIDAGTGLCPPPETDQRGVERPIGEACDIGAYESEQSALLRFSKRLPQETDVSNQKR